MKQSSNKYQNIKKFMQLMDVKSTALSLSQTWRGSPNVPCTNIG